MPLHTPTTMTRPAPRRAALTQAELLLAWESGQQVDPVARAVALAGAAAGATFAEVSDLPIGARDALLVDLQVACFGPDLHCTAVCPACGEELDVTVGEADLRRPEVAPGVGALEAGGRRVRYRALTSRDLMDLDPNEPEPHRWLAHRCVLEVTDPAGGDVPDDNLPDDAVRAVAAALPGLDPQADLRVDLECAVCGHPWSAPFDAAGHVWAEVDAFARRLLADVHALAVAYGWRESDVLSLSPVRRSFYLEASS
jgi:hypothetical protein